MDIRGVRASIVLGIDMDMRIRISARSLGDLNVQRICLLYTSEMVKTIITNEGGEVTKEDIWGTKKLAYPIQKKNEGYYAVVEFKAGTELPKELDRRLRISDACIRHIIVNKDEK